MNPIATIHDVLGWAHADSDLAGRIGIAVGVVIAAKLIAGISNWLLRRVYWRRVQARTPEQVSSLRRTKRQQTIVSLLESLARYVIYGAAAVIALTVLYDGAASALFGASLVVVLVGFGLQRLLGDVLAGGLLLFEGHYAVGDFIQVNQPTVSGVVEEFNLRNTTLRTLSGDRVVVLNGSITAFTRYPRGYRNLHLELLVEDDGDAREAVRRVLDRMTQSPRLHFLTPPELAVDDVVGSGVARLGIDAVVPPTLEWLVDRVLVAELTRELGDRLIGTVEVHDVDDGAFASYRSSVIVT